MGLSKLILFCSTNLRIAAETNVYVVLASRNAGQDQLKFCHSYLTVRQPRSMKGSYLELQCEPLFQATPDSPDTKNPILSEAEQIRRNEIRNLTIFFIMSWDSRLDL